jgi:hypothetical protein
MGLRFFHRTRLLPGLTLNLSKNGASLSAGVRGAHVTLNTRGELTETVGVPGTGVFYTQKQRLGQPQGGGASPPAHPRLIFAFRLVMFAINMTLLALLVSFWGLLFLARIFHL